VEVPGAPSSSRLSCRHGRRPTKQTLHSWTIYQIAKKQRLGGFVDAPDDTSAIACAID
jgi:hypothetical protein